MKLSAMPARVDSKAARGVALRIRSATSAREELDDSRAKRGHEPGLPGDPRRVGKPELLREGFRRQHHQEHVSEEGDGVDPVGEGAHVGPSRALGQSARLVGVEQVADQDRHGRSRKHAAVDELRREAEHEPAERVDEKKLDEVVEGEAKEPVDVAGNDRAHRGRIAHRVGLGGPFWGGASAQEPRDRNHSSGADPRSGGGARPVGHGPPSRGRSREPRLGRDRGRGRGFRGLDGLAPAARGEARPAARRVGPGERARLVRRRISHDAHDLRGGRRLHPDGLGFPRGLALALVARGPAHLPPHRRA